MSVRVRSILVGAIVAAFAVGGALADDLPAVSSFNGKVEALGGDIDGDGVALGGASLSFPLGQHFGAQIDAVGGHLSNSVKGGGAHLFWRDPGLGLVGVTGSRSGFGAAFGNRFGIEADWYATPSLTVGLTGGVQNGELHHTGYGSLDLRWYPTDNLMLEAGPGFYSDERTGHVGLEWRPDLVEALPGLALFADVGRGIHDYDHALAGIRIYFGGGDKSLKSRHREDDPLNMLVGGVASNGAAAGVAASKSGVARASGGAGGMGCFIAGTAVLMADGTTRAIEDVKVGDKLLGADGAMNEVLELKRPTLGSRKLYSVNGGAGFVTDSHPFMTAEGWKSVDPAATARENPTLAVGKLAAGDRIVTRDQPIPLTSIAAGDGAAAMTVYNFRLSGNHTYFIRPPGGQGPFLLVHNK